MAEVRFLFSLGIVAAPALLVACSSVWGFDTLVVGDAGNDGGASSGGDAASTGDASQDSTSLDGPATDGAGMHDGSHHDASSDTGADGPNIDAGDAGITVPPGWTLVEAAFSSSTPPACGAAWATSDTLVFDGVSAPAATCGCSCGAPTGFTCTFPVVTCTVTGGICQGCGTSLTNVPAGTCVGGWYQSMGLPAASGGACTPSPSTDVPTLSWGGQVRLCTQTAAVPPVSDAGFKVCVEQAGAQTCPGTFPNRHVEYSGADDTRSCSACTCGSPSGVTCGGTWSVFTDGSCQTFTTSYGLSFGPCTGYGASGGSSMYQAAPSGGSCAAATVTPTGSATPTGATTICCQ